MSIQRLRPSLLVRRVVSVVVGVIVGVTLWIGKFHTHPPKAGAAIVSEGSHARTLSPQQASRQAPAPKQKKSFWQQVGLASWYGPQFQGKQAANGEPYNMNELTCAHRFLPLGTWLKVTNVHTGKWVVVQVTDRGPAPPTRIIDLSSGAARVLGVQGRGVTRVRLNVIDPHQAVEVARLERLRIARQAAQADATLAGE